MKIVSVLIFVIFNAILWSLINSVKNNKGQKELNKVGEGSKNIENRNKNDGAESLVGPQIQNPNETSKNAEEDTAGNDKRKLYKREYMKVYRQNNKEKLRTYDQNYKNKNRERIRENARNCYNKNKENASFVEKKKVYSRNYNKNYYQNNKEKFQQNNRKYRQKMKNENEIEESSKLGKQDSANNEGASFVNPQIYDFRDKGKEPIVFEESLDTEEGDHFNHEEEEYEENEAEDNFDYLNQIEIEEPNEVRENKMDQINLNKNNYCFDLNEKPEDEQEDD
ncbi:unnamed protein product [Meloidogyne enterolobii]|uniref:Uncharacterized protein n=1 Tax=Meloidogyne enterolobii TaxID=390850 RepID=A0ACB1AR46_MELEN